MSSRNPSDPHAPGAHPDAHGRDAAPADAPVAPPVVAPPVVAPPVMSGGDRLLRRGDPATAATSAASASSTGGETPKRAEEREERRRERRRDGRRGVGRRTGEQDAGTATEQRPTGDRRRTRTLNEQREQWSEVSRWLRRYDLVEFRELLERLAQAAFGEAATVMPHLRRSRGRRYLVLVVDAACPEACTDYGDFLPLERAFWTAYATIPKPTTPFVVAVRPARGWCRSEALMPLFAQLPASDHIT